MSDYIKPTKKDFNPGIYVLHVGTNNLTLSDTPEQIAEYIFDIVRSIKTDSNTVIISNIVPRGNKNKENIEKTIQIINNACVQHNVSVINHTNVNSNRHLNRSKLHLNGFESPYLLEILKIFRRILTDKVKCMTNMFLKVLLL